MRWIGTRARKAFDRGETPKQARKLGGGLASVLAVLLVFAGVALAAVGLQNPSFEADLDNWTAKTLRGSVYDTNREVVYGPGGTSGPTVPCDSTPYGICVVGHDEFEAGGHVFSVDPVHGDKMLRLAGPFESSNQQQVRHEFLVEQAFAVDSSNPIVQANFNFFSFDYDGYDEFRVRARVTDEDGELISQRVQGGFATGTQLKTTGWQPVQFDLSAYAGQQVLLQIGVQGTSDRSFGTWAYVDAGTVPPPAASGSNTQTTVPGISVNKQVDPGTGQAWFIAPAASVTGCVPVTVTTPIEPGSGVVSNVELQFISPSGNHFLPMSSIGGNNWRATVPCFANGSLFVAYDLTEGSETQRFVIPLGGLLLIDPQGVVYDQAKFNAAKAQGKTDAQARSEAAIQGATVRLQRKTGGTFVNVLSGDPGITPNVNPQTTGTDGLYQWDVSAGEYRVVVSKSGYVTKTSQSVTIPPPVLDLHIGLTKPGVGPDGGGGSGTTDPSPDPDGTGDPDTISQACVNAKSRLAAATQSLGKKKRQLKSAKKKAAQAKKKAKKAKGKAKGKAVAKARKASKVARTKAKAAKKANAAVNRARSLVAQLC